MGVKTNNIINQLDIVDEYLVIGTATTWNMIGGEREQNKLWYKASIDRVNKWYRITNPLIIRWRKLKIGFGNDIWRRSSIERILNGKLIVDNGVHSRFFRGRRTVTRPKHNGIWCERKAF